jgi:enoyl-CoA hydratase/carnithine racemase
MSATFSTLRYQTDGTDVALITVSRPDLLNRMDRDVDEEFDPGLIG